MLLLRDVKLMADKILKVLPSYAYGAIEKIRRGYNTPHSLPVLRWLTHKKCNRSCFGPLTRFSCPLKKRQNVMIWVPMTYLQL